ncbi:MAG: hypothetical protein QNK05_20490 [Myxococcota bacterium]|nr:hypothetical protein [Myxococcota bacterium]
MVRRAALRVRASLFLAAIACSLPTLVTAEAAQAFAITSSPLFAKRWAPESGLSDGIQVGVSSTFATDIGAADAEEVALVNQAVVDAFAAWESPSLQFDVVFDDSVEIGTQAGFEIDVFGLPGDHPAFGGFFAFGRAELAQTFADRTLTNGTAARGFLITGADIYINAAAIALVEFFLPDDQARLDALTRLMMHEIGHTIGLAHPESFFNYDDDDDPDNPMRIDPTDPFSTLRGGRQNFAVDAIMNIRPCGDELIDCPPLYYTELTNDDLGGRDALYPFVGSEPSGLPAILGVLGLGTALTRRR